ncbi:MAG: diguanylate cyclase [Cyanobacteria bacterium P01_A01_bin.114]
MMKSISSRFVALDQPVFILAIDSPERELAPLIKALELHGYNIQVYIDPQANLRTVQVIKPDLILINLRTSRANGYQLCQSVQKTPELQDTPVVFVGSDTSKVQSVLALRSGGSDYLSFPIRLEECVLRLQNHLQIGKLVRRLKFDNAGLTHQIQQRDRTLRERDARALNLAEENQTLQRLVYIDTLTQIANRRGFNQQLEDLWSKLGQAQQPLALLMCDVDHFKAYNDTYGHPAGDSCLQMIAHIITQATLNPAALVARYGGEEFAIVMPMTGAQKAARLADKIQTALSNRRWPHKTSSANFVSLSIGVASTVPSVGLSPDTLIRMADEALYAAKLQGRDRIVVANPSYRLAAASTAYYPRQALVNSG